MRCVGHYGGLGLGQSLGMSLIQTNGSFTCKGDDGCHEEKDDQINKDSLYVWGLSYPQSFIAVGAAEYEVYSLKPA